MEELLKMNSSPLYFNLEQRKLVQLRGTETEILHLFLNIAKKYFIFFLNSINLI